MRCELAPVYRTAACTRVPAAHWLARWSDRDRRVIFGARCTSPSKRYLGRPGLGTCTVTALLGGHPERERAGHLADLVMPAPRPDHPYALAQHTTASRTIATFCSAAARLSDSFT